ncbi:MAG: hypothetical protein KatS3mg113_0967 [Planctomycetaceae bacterium]|nr:MAG: hypothetical protein KatS3mg113_0967 [Planctomycetaceae bacterium]
MFRQQWQWWQDQMRRAEALLARKQQIETQAEWAASQEHTEFERVRTTWEQASQAEFRQLEESFEQQQVSLEQAWLEECAQSDRALSERLSQIDNEYQQQLEQARQRRDEAEWLVGTMLDADAPDSPQHLADRYRQQWETMHAVLEQRLTQFEQQQQELLSELAQARFVLGSQTQPIPKGPEALELLAQQCLQALEQGAHIIHTLRRMRHWRLFRGFVPFFLSLGLAALLTGVVISLVAPTDLGLPADHLLGWWGIAGGVSLSVVILLGLFIRSRVNDQVTPLLMELAFHYQWARVAWSRWKQRAEQDYHKLLQDLQQRSSQEAEERQRVLALAERDWLAAMQSLEEWKRTQTQQAVHQHQQQRQETWQRYHQQLSLLQDHFREQQQRWESTRHDHLRQLMQEHDHRLQEIRCRREHLWSLWIQEAREFWRDVCHTLREWQQTAAAWDHPWDDYLTRQQFAGELQACVPVGVCVPPLQVCHWFSELHQSLSAEPPADLRTPVFQDLQSAVGYAILAREERHLVAALPHLQGVLLRWLVSFPPGRVQLFILDGEGLGDSFATFMHLADGEEQIISRKIWTDPDEIDEQLALLNDHVEQIVQHSLRDEYSTLFDYNRQAGELAEPYRLLVIHRGSGAWTAQTWRRLRNLLGYGGRGGVIPLVLMASNSLKESTLPASLIRQRCLVWGIESDAENSERLRLIEPDWPDATCESPPWPSVETVRRLLHRWGTAAAERRRVIIPFSRIVSEETALWTASSRDMLRIPLGWIPPRQVLHAELGMGLAQHMLVAGKTGSGKSTLFHTLIVSAATAYSPEELQFYLIDFKKGVEFQVYARCQLPHARVIAMESDREFAVSVLENLDRELQQRSELFRAAGVVDLGMYRRQQPQLPLPRVLLIIDEFQELFTEEDSLAQRAQLLLDRLIRQGRAFGVHVVLGSQTLAGAYTLARSTLGQIAVRVALQCSEHDAHLILGEQNRAAQFLRRPGEAIYNDANGAVEENRIFQVAWLTEEERERRLQRLHDRYLGPSFHDHCLVFEGFAPVSLSRHPFWQDRQRSHAQVALASHAEDARQRQDKASPTVWLGETVSLRGPLSVPFRSVPGHHVLIAGADENLALGISCAAAFSWFPNHVTQFPFTVEPDAESTGAELCARQSSEPLSMIHQPVVFLLASPHEETHRIGELLTTVAPHVGLVGPEHLESVLSVWHRELRARAQNPGEPRLLILFDLVRLRKLRKPEDDYRLGRSAKEPMTAYELFAELVREGSAVGLHVLVWCDSVNTLQRWWTRELLSHFERRVALPMNAGDSSAFLDSPAAGKLGIGRALFYDGERGLLEKFRPYVWPESHDLSQQALVTPLIAAEQS